MHQSFRFPFVALVGLLLSSASPSRAENMKSNSVVKPESIAKARPSHATKALMYEKLEYSKRLLQSVVTDDSSTLVGELKKLKDLATASTWYQSQDEAYKRYSGNFLEAIDRMMDHDRQGNREGVRMAYVQLVLSCMSCHEAVRDSK